MVLRKPFSPGLTIGWFMSGTVQSRPLDKRYFLPTSLPFPPGPPRRSRPKMKPPCLAIGASIVVLLLAMSGISCDARG